MSADLNYTSIRVSTLRGDLQIPFDAYIHVAGKYILYGRKGSTFEGTRLERLKAKKLKALFIKKDDDLMYRQYLETSIDSAYDPGTGKSILLRAEVIQGFQQAAAEQYLDDPMNLFAYDHVMSSVQRFVGFITNEPAAVSALIAIPNNDKSISHHGVNVATLSIAMALTENIKESKLITVMALGALLHDVELFHSNFDVTGSPSSYTPAILDVYKKHPIDGAQRLQDAKFVDHLVSNIILQHEEHIDGSGFPKGLREKDMDPLVMLVATANAFDRLIHFENQEPKTALKSLFIDKLGAFPLKALQTLQTVLKQNSIV